MQNNYNKKKLIIWFNKILRIKKKEKMIKDWIILSKRLKSDKVKIFN
jgi:hypothetical protein